MHFYSCPSLIMYVKYIFYFVLFISLTSCGIFKKNKQIESIDIVYANDAKVNYGHSFQIEVKATYSNGKSRDIASKKGVEISASGGSLNGRTIYIDGYPQSLRKDTVFIKAKYVSDEKDFSTEKAIPFNYRGDLSISFSGEQGAPGEDGSNGSTPLLFRDGKTGGDGLTGGTGFNGDDLSVNIWKTDNGLYRIKVINLITNETFNYTWKDIGYKLIFNLNGGQGGPGGNGGRGGDGKDGVITEKKNKRPGDGGDGGNGGIGGQGGNGGSLYVFLHPNAEELRTKIILYNFGGSGGGPGKGGQAGTPGTPESGQDSAEEGIEGVPGTEGPEGTSGIPLQLAIEAFDIEE